VTDRAHLSESARLDPPFSGAVPGTWWVDPGGADEWVLAYVVCPACSRVGCLSRADHKVARRGTPGLVEGGYACPHRPCAWRAELVLDGWHGDGQHLYAHALMRYDECVSAWVPGGFAYNHATSPEHALAKYRKAGIPPTVRVISTALAVGFHAEDEHGEVLRA
jgi:hypothetical protein